MTPQSDDTQPRMRDREKTGVDLKLALHRLQERGEKVSISAVAKETGVTAALLHNRYPDFAEEIRRLIGKATREQRDEKHDLLRKEREKNRSLRTLVDSQIMEIVKLASINEALRAELVIQKAIAGGKVAKGAFSR